MRSGIIGSIFISLIVMSVPVSAQEERFTIDGIPLTVDLTPHAIANDPSSHFTGIVIGEPNSWARLSLIDGQWQGIVSLNKKLHLIEPATTAGKNRTAKALDSAPIPFTCGSTPFIGTSPATSSLQQAMRATSATFSNLCSDSVDGVCAVVELELAFDKSFISAYPSSYQAQGASLLNMVEGLYINNFGIVFDNLSMSFLSTQVFTTDNKSENYLLDIQKKKASGLSFVTNNSAILHVVRGKSFSDNSTAGIAYIDGLCDTEGYSVGTSVLYRQTTGSAASIPITAIVTTHEIGHNLGAYHDNEGTNNCRGGSIMDPVVNPETTSFSTCSYTDISALLGNLSSWNQCTDYPVKLDVKAESDNDLTLSAPATITHQFDLSYEQGYVSPAQPLVTGTLEGAVASAATLAGVACTLSNSGTSYSCPYPRTASATLQLTFTPTWTRANITSQATFSGDANLYNVARSTSSLSYTVNTNGPASPSSLQSTDEGTQITLTWQDNEANETGFSVQRRTNSGVWGDIATTAANVARYTDTSATAQVLYEYRVLTETPNIDSTPSNTVSVDRTVKSTGSSGGGGGGGGGSSTLTLLTLLALQYGFRRRHF